MTLAMEALIQDRWREEKAPIIDGVLFASGDIALFRYEWIAEPSIGVRAVATGQHTTLQEFLDAKPGFWTALTELGSVPWLEGGLRIVCGGGGFGADGYVGACVADTNYLLWLAFFQESNPFDEITLEGATAIARSTYGQRWTFPIREPLSFSVGDPAF